jgi:hypothetical protein
MNMLNLIEIILVVLLLRALFPLVMRLVRGGQPGSRGRAERYKEELFDKKKMDIEDGEYKEIK